MAVAEEQPEKRRGFLRVEVAVQGRERALEVEQNQKECENRQREEAPRIWTARLLPPASWREDVVEAAEQQRKRLEPWRAEGAHCLEHTFQRRQLGAEHGTWAAEARERAAAKETAKEAFGGQHLS